MAYTQADLERIEAAIATGTRTVSVDGRTVTYDSLSDLLRRRDLIKKAISNEQSTGVPAGRRYGRMTGGFG